MINKWHAIICICFLAPVMAQSRPHENMHPKQELRAIWLTTVFGLDWPGAQDPPEIQESKLREIIRDAKSKGMNAVFFQAVSRADAMYPSERLPWAPWLTGTAGKDPGWDPLRTAIEEAHSLGMELHAWYNVYTSGNDRTPYVRQGNPLHVQAFRPEWIDTVPLGDNYNGYYLNPGYPGVSEWIAGNVLEIIDHYDVDGIHFDYIRYGANYGRDTLLFRQYNPGNITNLNAWRRENVNNFVRLIYPAVKERKPWVKVGSSVIGGYQNFHGSWPGFWGYDNAHQDGRAWVAEGVHDYLTPMLYTTIGRAPMTGRTVDSPDFAWLLQQWVDHRSGKHVYAGLGTYVPDVREEIPVQIDTLRSIGAQGHAHFRYRFLDPWLHGGRYRYPAIIPSMPWLNQVTPPSPRNLQAEIVPLKSRDPVSERGVAGAAGSQGYLPGSVSGLSSGPGGSLKHELMSGTGISSLESGFVIRLKWEKPQIGREPDPFLRFAVYGAPTDSYIHPDEILSQSRYLADITGLTEMDISLEDDGLDYDFFVTALTRNHIESVPAVTRVSITHAGHEPDVGPGHEPGIGDGIPQKAILHHNYPNPFNSATIIRFELPDAQHAKLTVYDITGRIVKTLVQGEMSAGIHQVIFDVDNAASGVYTYRLQAGESVITRKMTIVR